MITLASLLFAVTLDTSVKRLASTIDAKVGVAAIELENGNAFHLRADESFPMASVFKLPLALTVLRRADSGALKLDHAYTITPRDFSLGHSPIRERAKGKPVTLTLRELVVAAVSDSDNTAGDFLVRLVTPAAVTQRMRELSANGIRVDRTEKAIIETFSTPGGVAKYATDPRDTATPVAMVRLLRSIYERTDGLKPASHEFLVGVMTKTANPVRIGKLLPQGCVVAHKTGTMPGTMNDAGIITSPDGKHHFAVVILTKASTHSSEEKREQVIAQIARAVYDALIR
jgi:beta-lactamase class A